MITEDNKEAIRERIQGSLANLEKQLEESEKSYMKDSLKEAIDKNKAILQELDANAALGTETLRNLMLTSEAHQTCGEANRDVIRHRAVLEVHFDRLAVAAEKQAAAFERIAMALAAKQ